MITGIKKMLAQRRIQRFRFAVLRPADQSRVPSPEKFRSFDGMPSADFQREMDAVLGNKAIFVGYVCAGDKTMTLYGPDGMPTGEKTKPGDVLDEIADMQRALDSGVYQWQRGPA